MPGYPAHIVSQNFGNFVHTVPMTSSGRNDAQRDVVGDTQSVELPYSLTSCGATQFCLLKTIPCGRVSLKLGGFDESCGKGTHNFVMSDRIIFG